MAFQAEQKPINHLLTNNVLGIPRNQRVYVWKKDNWLDLLSDIEFVVKSEEGKNHFIGSIVLKQEDSINGLDNFTIIDGQQRTITILLLLSSIMKLFQENDMKEDFMGTIQYLISKDRKSVDYCGLSSESHIFVSDFVRKVVDYEDRSSINSLIEKSVIDRSREKNLIECIKFFYDSIIENEYSDAEVNNFVESLKKKTPTIKTFTEKFSLLGWSNHYDFYRDSKNKERVKTVLELLESHFSGIDFIDDFTIEHILPDSQDNTNCLIGNLIPLEANYNKNCMDKDLVEKLPYYAKSKFKLAKKIAERYKDKSFDPNVRMEYMAKTIYNEILNLG